MHGLIDGTPIEKYNGIYVKREDLCCLPPGPPFSKVRGVVEHIRARPEKIFGCLDTFHSQAGVGVAWACKNLHRKCVNFYPVYKAEAEGVLRENQQKALRLGAVMVPLQAGRSAILFHRARKLLEEQFPGAYMMPNALKLPESVEATAREVERSAEQIRRIKPDQVVVSISSGTIAAGVVLGLSRLKLRKVPTIWLHEGYSRSEDAVRAYLNKMVGNDIDREFQVIIVDEKYAYKDTAPRKVAVPFPSNEFYDKKAWCWLQEAKLTGNVLMWNVG
jgi:1-aminocyclopropane-1-carboxylate deaminase/D-cysteine desulfhydrase-like pyridoxal-dependent ACC family enzyme